MKFKVINKIPRIVLFSYKSISTNGQQQWRQFVFPTGPFVVFTFIRNFLFGDKNVYKDELGIFLSHDDIYKEEDIILAVGVGSGLSLVHNCAKKRIPKSFIGIEGSKEQIEIAKANAKLNGIDFSMFDLIEGYAGNPNYVYGDEKQRFSNIIDINKLKFNVLELDCEGSEIEILRDLQVRPRHIIVEMHPMYRDININKFLEEMNIKGYSLGKIFTVNGESDDTSNLDNYFKPAFILTITKNQISWGDGLLVLNFSLK